MPRPVKQWASVLIFFSLFILFQVYGQDIVFKFKQPDKLAYTQTLKTIKNKTAETGESQVDSTISEVLISVNKTDSGYSITATPSSMKMYRNGQLIESPIVSILNNLIVTYQVDNHGQLLDIIGYDQFLSEIEKTMPSQVLEVLKSVVNKDVIVAKETEEWNGRIGGFAGATVKLGDTWKDTTLYQLPSGEAINYYTVTSFDEWVEVSGKKCLKVSFSYSSDPSALAGVIDEVMSETTKSVGDTVHDIKSSVSELFGSGYRLIDPNTMLIYEEISNRTLKLFVTSPGQQQMMTSSYEERNYTYNFAN